MPFSITEKDIPIPTHCPVLGVVLKPVGGGMHHRPDSPSVDEILPGKGYVPGNVAVISWRANSLKRDGSLEDFCKIVAWLERVGSTPGVSG